MTASPDDAAASDSPPRAAVRAAAPSCPGVPGRRRPEGPPMAQHPPAHDETVRMRPDGAPARPTLENPRVAPVHAQGVSQGAPAAAPVDPTPDREFDDTRPVGRDWLQGAPEAEAQQT